MFNCFERALIIWAYFVIVVRIKIKVGTYTCYTIYTVQKSIKSK